MKYLRSLLLVLVAAGCKPTALLTLPASDGSVDGASVPDRPQDSAGTPEVSVDAPTPTDSGTDAVVSVDMPAVDVGTMPDAVAIDVADVVAVDLPDVPGRVCVPNAATCTSSTQRSVCNADGLGATVGPCPTPAHATAARCMEAGVCAFDCESNFADCNGLAADGCEVPLQTDSSHCGTCTTACSAVTFCLAGRCATMPSAAAPALGQPREAFAIAPLSSGRVVVAGGRTTATGASLNTTEIFDPLMNRWTGGPSLPVGVAAATAVRARDGRVFLFGGYDGSSSTNTVQVLDVGATAWSLGSPMLTARDFARAIVANDGRIFVLGGGLSNVTVVTRTFNAVEVYDPVANRWSAVSPLREPRAGHGVALLPDGRIAVFGGVDVTGTARYFASVEFYDPSTGLSVEGPAMPTQLSSMGYVLANDGLIHLIGGYDGLRRVAAHYAFNPVGGAYRVLAALPETRIAFGVTEAPAGTLLAVGGRSGSSETVASSVASYTLATDAWR